MILVEYIKAKLAAYEKENLCFLPTPLKRSEFLSDIFCYEQAIDVYIKRDDQTGLAMGGNKARKLEYIMADARKQHARSIITWGGMYSNWCRQLAAAAIQCDIKPVLVLLKKRGSTVVMEGNPLLDRLIGADIRVIEVDEERKIMELAGVKDIIEPIVEEQTQKGNQPYLVPIGGSLMEGSMHQPLGALAYVECFLEILEQQEEHQAFMDTIVVPVGSAGTYAGLLAGAKMFAPHMKVVGVSVSEDKVTLQRYIETITRAVFKELGVEKELKPKDIQVFDQYIGKGYGVLTTAVAETMQMLASSEGILLDPVYTGKAMMAMLDKIENSKYFNRSNDLVFVHTGGLPTIFSYSTQLQELLEEIEKERKK